MNYILRGAVFARVFGCLVNALACSSYAHRADEPGGALQKAATNTCPEAPVDLCALPSPLMDLAERALSENRAGAPPVHYASIVDDGSDALGARLHVIRAARKSIEIQVFIWSADTVGAAMLRELQEAARRGVRVRLILDQLASSSDIELATVLAVVHENLEVRYYRPIAKKISAGWLDYFWSVVHRTWRTQQRMHNKLIVVDSRLLIVGGLNLADEYFDVDPEFNFSDRDVIIAGPVAVTARESFERYWQSPEVVPAHDLYDVHKRLFDRGVQQPVPDSINSVRRDIKPIEHVLARIDDPAYIRNAFAAPAIRIGEVSLVADDPDKVDPDAETDVPATLVVIQARLSEAKSSILIQTPYLLLTEENLEGIQQLNVTHPEIRVRISTSSLSATDSPLVYGVYYKLRTEYMNTTNMEIHEYKGHPRDGLQFNKNYIELADLNPTEAAAWRKKLEADPNTPLTDELRGPRFGLHAKAIVVDNRRVVIGSHNFDPRSITINTEVVLSIDDEAFAQAMTRSIEKYMKPGNSWTIAPKARNAVTPVNTCLSAGSRALPVFDIYPWTGTGSFQMIENGADLRRNDAEF